MKSYILNFPRWLKQFIAIVVDIFCAIFATWLAFSLRLEEWHGFIPEQKFAYLGAVLISIPVFIYFGVYKTVLRFSGAHSIALISRAVAIYGVVYFAAIFMLASPYVYRSIGLVQPIILFILMALFRIAASISFGFTTYGKNGRPVLGTLLIYGAGQSGMQIATALRQSGQYFLAGFIDDSQKYQGTMINGLMVYSPNEISRLIETHGVSDILLAMPSIDRSRRNQILQNLRDYHVHVRSLPDLVDLAQGLVTVLDIKELEPDDLLGRASVEPDPELMLKDIQHKIVLVTGAGGSIGSELCRQIIKAQPDKILLLDHSEFNLYKIESELSKLIRASSHSDEEKIIPILASVKDEHQLKKLFSQWSIDTIYHAAAYKHVPLVECNPIEGVQNNVIGTFNLANLAQSKGVKNFVLISTDKAVRPTNVMGASKRFAELILQALADNNAAGTCFSIVRFGNVLDSSGSVVPLFREQIRVGGPITLTHPEVTRYFMTIPEAAQLVIQAGAMAKGGEVFVLDMGEPVKIYDLARRMIQLSGLSIRDKQNPHGDIEIVITGLRPGEKLYEELLIGNNPIPTKHPRILMAKEDYLNINDLLDEIMNLKTAINKLETEKIITQLEKIVYGYQSKIY